MMPPHAENSRMHLNAFFPTREIGTDPVKIRDWAQAAEDLGYFQIEVADHVFGAAAREGFAPTYNETDPFHETFTTLAFLAAATKTIGLSSGVLILPQRQTGVVAKQARRLVNDMGRQIPDIIQVAKPLFRDGTALQGAHCFRVGFGVIDELFEAGPVDRLQPACRVVFLFRHCILPGLIVLVRCGRKFQAGVK